MLDDGNDLIWENSNSYEEYIENDMKEIDEILQFRKDRKFKIGLIVAIILCIIICIYEVTCTVIVKTRNIMPEILYDGDEFLLIKDRLKHEYINIQVKDMTIPEIKKQAAKEVPLTWCIQIDVPELGNKGGTCSFLLGLIQITTNQNSRDYTKALVHERLHLYYYTACERFTQYKTFVTLYESENLFFKKAGIELAREILSGLYPRSYNCTGQIIEYLIERG